MFSQVKLVLITGCQRSGTTLLGQIIGAQHRAILIDEDDGSMQLVRALLNGHTVEQALRQSLLSARKKYLDGERVTDKGEPMDGITHLIIKAPNAAYFREQLARLPMRIAYLFLVRDVRDVVCSMGRLPHIPMVDNQVQLINEVVPMRDRFCGELRELTSPAVTSLVKRALIWRIKTSLYRDFESAPTAALTVRYEDLVTDKDQWLARILTQIGMATDAPPSSHEGIMKGIGPGFTFRERPVDRASLYRWVRVLEPAQEEQIWQIGGELMGQLGYPRRVQSSHESFADAAIERPVIVIGRGGSGTRLVSQLLHQLGVFLGNKLNETGDSVEWADLVYEMVIKIVPKRPERFGHDWIEEIRARTRNVLATGNWTSDRPWGFKLPETLLVLPEILSAFPDATIVHVVRHPIDSSLRRTHTTSRTDNLIGQAALTAAYRCLGWDRNPAQDEDYLRNAASWRYQVEWVNEVIAKGQRRYVVLRYEDICANPQGAQDTLAENLGLPKRRSELEIDPSRHRQWAEDDPRADEVWRICDEAATRFGYQRL